MGGSHFSTRYESVDGADDWTRSEKMGDFPAVARTSMVGDFGHLTRFWGMGVPAHKARSKLMGDTVVVARSNWVGDVACLTRITISGGVGHVARVRALLLSPSHAV